MNWLRNNADQLWLLTWNHVWLSLPAIAIAMAISIPVGWLAHRRPRLGQVILSISSAVYALPSLALFVVLPLVLGTRILNPVNVVVAMSLYGVALMLRPVVDSFAAIPSDIKSAGLAVGHTGGQLFWLVELPLAGPSILAGLRVVSAAIISMVSVGALIGVSSLGYLFTDGFARDYGFEIVVGLVATLLLAAALDLALVVGGHLLMPWTRVPRS